jgi:hypothetical protein
MEMMLRACASHPNGGIFILLPLSETEASSLRKILKQVYISDFGSSIVDDAYVVLKKLNEKLNEKESDNV